MKFENKQFFYAVSTLVGYVVGAGIFGLPFAMDQFGFFPSIGLLILLSLTTILNILSLLEVILRTPGEHYFCGLVKYYFGEKGRWLELVLLSISTFGALLAYFVLGSIFLSDLFGFDFQNQEVFFLLMFLVTGSIFIWKGFKELGVLDYFMFTGLIVIVVMLLTQGYSKIEVSNYNGIDLLKFFSVFGVMLFALDGVNGIFIVKNILKNRPSLIKHSVYVSYLVIIIIFILFSSVLIGIFGNSVPVSGITNIGFFLGNWMEKVVIVFGILAIFSSYLVLGSNFKNTLMKDFGLRHIFAWFFVWFVPLFFYLLGFQNFIEIISLVGVIFGTLNTLLIFLLLIKSRKIKKKIPKFKLRTPIWLNFLVILLYLIAMSFEIYSFFIK